MIEAGTYTKNIWQGASERTAGRAFSAAQPRSSAARAEADSFDALVKSASAETQTQSTKSSSSVSAEKPAKEENGFIAFFKVVLDIINPLQHIPVVNTIYRHLTGDEISPVARLAGDTLFGGPLGAAVALADIAIESHTGKDLGKTAMAFFDGKKDKSKEAAPTMLAAAKLDNIQPSAGGDQIIWNDAVAAYGQKEFSSSPSVAPTSSRNGMNERGPAAPPPSHATPVPSQKNGTSLPAHDEIMARAVEAGTENVLQAKDAPTTVLHSQDAPAADLDRKSRPSELLASGKDKSTIAQRMMDGLDKYGAMKKAEYSINRTF